MLGRFHRVEPEWKGSSYSYIHPSRRKTKKTAVEKADNNNNNDDTRASSSSLSSLSPSETTWRLDFPNCGSISLQHDASHVASDGSDKTGLTLWSSALAMATYLDAHLPSLSVSVPAAMEEAANTTTTTSNATTSSIDNNNNGNTTATPITTLELGAGLGLPSIVLARHGNSGDVVRHVIATDYDPAVLRLLKQNIQNNLPSSQSSSSPVSVTIEPLDWSQPDEDIVQQLSPDLIIASDLIWNATRPVWRDLLSLLNRLRYNYHQKNNKMHSEGPKRKQRSPRAFFPTGAFAPPAATSFSSTSSSSLEDNSSDNPKYGYEDDPMVFMGYTQRRRDMTVEQESEFFALLQKFGMQARVLPDASFSNEHWPLTVLLELYWIDPISESMEKQQ